MTFVGVLFFLAGLAISVGLGLRARPRRLALPLMVGLYVWHTAMSVGYWAMARVTVADATGYFEASFYPTLFGISTNFIIWLLYNIRSFFDHFVLTTILDYYLFFNIFGYVGLYYLYRSLAEAAGPRFAVDRNKLVLMILFLPGMSFWTSAIGKDSLIFFGTMLLVHASLRLERRIPQLLIGLVVVSLIRPHIAAMAAVAVFGRFLIGGRLSAATRLAGIGVVLLAALVLQQPLMDFVQLGGTSRADLLSYIEARQVANLGAGSSIDIREYGVGLVIFTYLFRPLFFDATSFTMLMASMESAFLLLVFSVMSYRVIVFWREVRAEPAILFNLIYGLGTLVMLAMTTSNLGIAVRQKVMLLPSFFLVAVWLNNLALVRRAADQAKVARARTGSGSMQRAR